MRKTLGMTFTLLMLSPAAALAMGCGKGHAAMEMTPIPEAETAAISCAEGMTLDAETNECVATTG